MRNLIDINKLYDDILHDGEYDNDTINHFIDVVSAQEEIEAEPVRHGQWIEASKKSPKYACTQCRYLYNNKSYKYCPNCGARMDGKENKKMNRCNGCEFYGNCEYADNYNFCDDCKDCKDCSIRTVSCEAGFDIECNNGFEVDCDSYNE